MELAERIRKALENATSQEFTLKPIGDFDDDNFYAIVVSPAFRGVEGIDRQNLMWNALRAKLGEEELRKIVALLASTPEEEAAMAESIVA